MSDSPLDIICDKVSGITNDRVIAQLKATFDASTIEGKALAEHLDTLFDLCGDVCVLTGREGEAEDQIRLLWSALEITPTLVVAAKELDFRELAAKAVAQEEDAVKIVSLLGVLGEAFHTISTEMRYETEVVARDESVLRMKKNKKVANVALAILGVSVIAGFINNLEGIGSSMYNWAAGIIALFSLVVEVVAGRNENFARSEVLEKLFKVIPESMVTAELADRVNPRLGTVNSHITHAAEYLDVVQRDNYQLLNAAFEVASLNKALMG